MDKNKLIEDNNRKRKELTEENRKYYEDMLIYLRVSYKKSEQETEEILTEMLDHLLEAQAEGRSAEDVFGTQPKQYADEIIGELPKIATKETTGLITMGMLYFLAASTLLTGVIDMIAFYLFDQGDSVKVIHTGSFALKAIIAIVLVFLFAYAVIQYIRWSCFKKIKRVTEFIGAWLFGCLVFLVFLLIYYVMPAFGPVVEFPVYVSLLVGGVLGILGWLIRKRI
ncbi:hypothetical protein AOX59_07955 [Lentibacillus amyloliquefaciens]|uniref:DUF1129 domain-containing protein n=2 Tax=Lentibacillus amyloliquefaciens TaxID=1472767 RepID=A0A0U4FLF3_9BACI|nr:hypothetical protein AOX59_07955 [Lentibacillus amyloliquefaciens]